MKSVFESTLMPIWLASYMGMAWSAHLCSELSLTWFAAGVMVQLWAAGNGLTRLACKAFPTTPEEVREHVGASEESKYNGWNRDENDKVIPGDMPHSDEYKGEAQWYRVWRLFNPWGNRADATAV